MLVAGGQQAKVCDLWRLLHCELLSEVDEGTAGKAVLWEIDGATKAIDIGLAGLTVRDWFCSGDRHWDELNDQRR